MCTQIARASCDIAPSQFLSLRWGWGLLFWRASGAAARPQTTWRSARSAWSSAQASTSSACLWACDHLAFQKDRKVAANMPAVAVTLLILHNQLHQKPFMCLIMHDNFTCFTKRTNSIWPPHYQTWQPKTAGEICVETVINIEAVINMEW